MVNSEWEPHFLSLDLLSARDQMKITRIVVLQFQITSMENMNCSPSIRYLPLVQLIVARRDRQPTAHPVGCIELVL